MRIQIITTHLSPAMGWGGVLSANLGRFESLLQAAQDVYLMGSDGCRGRGRITVDDIRADGNGRIIIFKYLLSPRHGFSIDALPKVWGAVRKADIVLVGGVVTWPVTIAAIMAIILGRPFAVTLHGGLLSTHVKWMRTHKPLKWIYCRTIVFWLLRRAAFISVASDYERNGMIELMPNADVLVTANPVNTDKIRALPMPSEGVIRKFVYVGRFSEEKGTLALIRAWKRAEIEGAELTLVGSGSGRYAELCISEARGTSGIILRGELSPSQAIASIGAAQCIILPSGLDGPLKENFGNVVAEAMALGRPAIVPRGISWDYIADEGAGVVFEPTIDELVAAIGQVARLPPPQIEQMGLRARQLAEGHLSYEATTGILLRKFREVVHRDDGPVASPPQELCK